MDNKTHFECHGHLCKVNKSNYIRTKLILIGGTNKKSSKAAEISALIFQNSVLSSIEFLYSFRSPGVVSSPLIDIKDLLLQNAQQEYAKLSNSISSRLSNKKLTADFKKDISPKKLVDYINEHHQQLIVLGEPETKEIEISKELIEVNHFLSRTSCSVLIIPESSPAVFPENAQVISNLSALNALELLKEHLPFKPDHLRLTSINQGWPTKSEDKKEILCKKVKEKYYSFLQESFQPKGTDIIILALEKTSKIPQLELHCLYELCLSSFHVPLLIINPKLIASESAENNNG